MTKATVSNGPTYNWNTSGQITGSVNSNNGAVTNFSYTPATVTVTTGPNKAIYFVNAGGYADSSLKKNLLYNSTTGLFDTVQTKQYYFFEDGYLIRQMDLGNFKLPFNTYLDTLVFHYFYENGNLKKISSDLGPDLTYVYHSQLTDGYHFLDPRQLTLTCLGKPSKNLVDKMLDTNGNTLSQFLYLFDDEGKVINKRVLSGSTTTSIDFVYNCQ